MQTKHIYNTKALYNVLCCVVLYVALRLLRNLTSKLHLCQVGTQKVGVVTQETSCYIVMAYERIMVCVFLSIFLGVYTCNAISLITCETSLIITLWHCFHSVINEQHLIKVWRTKGRVVLRKHAHGCAIRATLLHGLRKYSVFR